MTHDDPYRGDALDRYWDAVQEVASPPGAPPEIDATATKLIAALHLQTGRPAPGLEQARTQALASFEAHLAGLATGQAEAPPALPDIPERRQKPPDQAMWRDRAQAPRMSPNGRFVLPRYAGQRPRFLQPEEPGPVMPEAPARRSSLPSWLSAAGLLLVLLAGGIVFSRAALQRGDEALEHLPANVETGERAPLAGEPLLDVVLPGWTAAAPIPTPTIPDVEYDTEWRIDAFGLDLTPGTSYVDPAGVNVGTVVTGVMQGTSDLSADGPAKLIRRGVDAASDVAPGTTVTLGVGDALVTDGETRRTIRPAGEEPATILELSARQGASTRGHFQTLATGVAPQALPAGRVQVRVERLTLPRADVLPIPRGATVLVRVEDGMVAQSSGLPGTATLSPSRSFTYRRGGYFIAADGQDPGGEVEAIDGPAQLLVITFLPT